MGCGDWGAAQQLRMGGRGRGTHLLVPSQAARCPPDEAVPMASLCLWEGQILQHGDIRRGCPAPRLASSELVLQPGTELDEA